MSVLLFDLGGVSVGAEGIQTHLRGGWLFGIHTGTVLPKAGGVSGGGSRALAG